MVFSAEDVGSILVRLNIRQCDELSMRYAFVTRQFDLIESWYLSRVVGCADMQNTSRVRTGVKSSFVLN